MLIKPNKIIPLVLCFLLIFEQSGLAQVSFSLDLSGYISGLKSTLTQDKYRPLHLRYLGYDAKSNDFKLLLDKGDFLTDNRNQRTENREQRTEKIKKKIHQYPKNPRIQELTNLNKRRKSCWSIF